MTFRWHGETAVSCVYDGKTKVPYKNTINPKSFLKK